MGNSDTGTVKRKPGRPKGSKNSKSSISKPKEGKRHYTVSEKAIAQRTANGKKNFDITPKNDAEKDYNSALIQHIMAINEIATHADRNDLNSLKSCFANYLQLCYQDGMPISNLQAYASMGFSMSDFQYWSKKDDPERRAFISTVKSTCAMSREGQVASGKLNPVIGIFWQRNYDGLRNDTEQIQAIQETDENYEGSSSYKEKYKKLIGE